MISMSEASAEIDAKYLNIDDFMSQGANWERCPGRILHIRPRRSDAEQAELERCARNDYSGLMGIGRIMGDK